MNERLWDPEGEAGGAFRAVVTEFGTSVLSDERLLKSSLSDVLPEGVCQREQSLLVAASKAGVAADLRQQLAGGMDLEGAVQLVGRRLGEAQPFDPTGCTWVVRQFAYPISGTLVPDQPQNVPMSIPQLELSDEETVGGHGVGKEAGVAVGPRGAPRTTPENERTDVARVAVLDPVRREPTLLLLALAALVSAIGGFTTSQVPINGFPHILLFAGIVSGLVAIAAFIGAGWARTPVAMRRGDPAALATIGIGLTIAAVGFVVQAKSFGAYVNATVGPRSFDIGVIMEIAGYIVISAMLVRLAVGYRQYRAGPDRHSPVIPVVGSAIGILAYRVPDIDKGSWFAISVSKEKLLSGAVAGGGVLLIALSLLVAAAWQLGPRRCLICAGVGVAIVGYADIHMEYSETLNGTFFAIGYAVILLALVVWIGTLATQTAHPSGLGSFMASLSSVSSQRAGDSPSSQVVVGSFISDSGTVGSPESDPRSPEAGSAAVAKRTILIGALIVVAGILILVVTYKLTSTRFFYFGPILIGILVMVRGIRAWLASSKQATRVLAAGASDPIQDFGSLQTFGKQNASQSPAPPTRPPPSFCSACGAQRAAEGRFCASCGQGFETRTL